MKGHTILVIADPADPRLKMLEELPPGTGIVAGRAVEALAGKAADAEVILNWEFSNGTLRALLPLCPKLKWVHVRAAGLDAMWFPALAGNPAVLTNGTGVFSQSLGEFALAAILYFAKDFRRMIRNQQASVWEPFDVLEISKQTVGILGYGDIGRAVASRARAMGMQVMAVKRHAPPVYTSDPWVSQIFGPEDRIEMLSRSDYVVVTAPLTAETRGMIGEREIAAMKQDAVIVNVGRGPIIDEAALISALSENRIKGAALDVFDREPLPAGHPFYSMENVLLSPHCADHTTTWVEDAMRFFIEQYERFAKGEQLLNVVDKKLGY